MRGESYTWLIFVQLLCFGQVLSSMGKKNTLSTPIGAIFAALQDTSIDEMMFQASIDLSNRSSSSFTPFSQLAQFNHVAFLANTENVDFANSYQVSNAICSQLSSAGVTSVFSTAPNKASEAILRSFSERFQVPYISASHYFLPLDNKIKNDRSNNNNNDNYNVNQQTVLSGAYQFSVSIRPRYIDAILGLRRLLGWKKLTYIVDGDEGITRIKELLRSQEATEFELLLRHMEPNKPMAVENMLRNISSLAETNIMIDCSVYGTFVFFDRAFDMQMILPSYNYVVVNLAATIALAVPSSAYLKYTKGGGNITGLFVRSDPPSIMNYYSKKKPINSMKEFSTMLTSDSVDLLKKSWESLIASDDFSPIAEQFGRSPPKGMNPAPTLVVGDQKNCGGNTNQESSLLGQTLMNYIKKTKFNGITGQVEFNERGERVNMGIELVQLSQSEKISTIATWNESFTRFEDTGDQSFESGAKKKMRDTRHIIITSIIEPPFLVRKAEAEEEGLTGNDRYEGYCVSLIDLLARDLQFTYTIQEVKDGEYGSEVKKANETEDGKPVWNGMIGEVIRGEADLAIAPLTINADRQRVVAFSKPFMNIGISIMIKKPQKELPGPLSFLDPFSDDIWYGIIIAYCGLSFGLFVVARFSPTEWQDIPGRPSHSHAQFVDPSGPVEKTNDFSFYNSMWFSLGALMQQGTDIAPRAPASRIVGGVWWFFTLIIISSYTANLAAFLTVETMIMPINNADELANQKDIEYGTRKSGSTMSFFKNSQIKVFEKMWDYMSANFDSVMVNDNFQGIEKVRSSNSRYAFLIESAMNEYIGQQKPCDTMKVGPNLDSKGYGIAAEYDSDIIKNITLRILQYQEEGELTRLRTMWWIDKGECGGSFSSTNTENTNSLGLSSVAGIFYILISGLVLAMVSAVTEYLYKSYKLHRSEQKSLGGSSSFKPNVRYMVTATDSNYRVPPPPIVANHNGPTPLHSSATPFNSLPTPLTGGGMMETQLLQQQMPNDSYTADYTPNEYWNKESSLRPNSGADNFGSQYIYPTTYNTIPQSQSVDAKSMQPRTIALAPPPHLQHTPKKFTDV